MKPEHRVLVFCSRGVSYRVRHLMEDLRVLMPHSKKENKMDRKENIFSINEICEMKNCNHCVYFEMRKKKGVHSFVRFSDFPLDTYMWLANTPDGPSVKFFVDNIHTTMELNMIGNCLKGSRPLLSFNKEFDQSPHWKLIKEMLIQSFGTPIAHPKSKPFFDHVFSFSIADNRIWFRNYQICETTNSGKLETQLVEIGPRFVLNVIRIFNGSFIGSTLYKNEDYKSPNLCRRLEKLKKHGKYADRLFSKRKLNTEKLSYELPKNELDDNLSCFVQTCVDEDLYSTELQRAQINENLVFYYVMLF